MITIRATQHKITVDTPAIKKTAQQVLTMLNYADFDLGIWLTTNKTIKKYNHLYRKKNAPTDILSFPFYPDLKAGHRIKPHCDDDKNLGDILISLEYAHKDAQKQGISLKKHLQVLLVHGICHLLGYDHIKHKDYIIMHAQEQKLLDIISCKLT